MQLALAPMEGLADAVLRGILTGVGGIDWCVSEFVRVNDALLPRSVFYRIAPELAQGSRTDAGTPMRLQLLGSNPACMADNAALACTLGAPVIDLNFGCPANTVNRSRGGAVLLKEPELLHRIVSAVRGAVPPHIPVTAKMRIGYENTDQALDCARALHAGGAALLVVHARTKTDGYRPPAYWEWIARIREVVPVPVVANGEIWTVEDWRRCRSISGAEHFMLGRGLVARPDLALQIRAAVSGQPHTAMAWPALLALVVQFWQRQQALGEARYAPGRLKQWLNWLGRDCPPAAGLFAALRAESAPAAIDGHLRLAARLAGLDFETESASLPSEAMA